MAAAGSLAVVGVVGVVDRDPEGVTDTEGVDVGDSDGDGSGLEDTDTEGVRDAVVLGVAEVDHVGDMVPSTTTGRVSVPAYESAVCVTLPQPLL